MGMNGYKRKLTAILSADAVGYSRLMRDDEEATVHGSDAKAHVAEALKMNPGLSIQSLRQRLPSLPENAVVALRKAGLPD
jgi:hypothetical protein